MDSVSIVVRAAEAVYKYCRDHTDARVIIGEGCGSGTTDEVFRRLGYVDLAEKYGIELVDFNEAEDTGPSPNPRLTTWADIFRPDGLLTGIKFVTFAKAKHV